MTRIVLQSVSVQFEAVTAVDDLTLDIAAGQRVAITGPSGSGKTTALRLIAGLLSPTSGQVVIGGESIGAIDEKERGRLRAKSFGFIYQDYNLLPYLTAIQNVEVTWRLRSGGLHPNDALDRVGLAHRAGHLPRQLSGGEQQRVSIARALCGDPDIVVADEPTGALDEATGDSVLNLLIEANEDRGVTLIVVTHDEAVADRMTRRIRLRDGALADAR